MARGRKARQAGPQEARCLALLKMMSICPVVMRGPTTSQSFIRWTKARLSMKGTPPVLEAEPVPNSQ